VTTGEKFEKAVGIMARLRAPGGCPWDREQTFDTIKRYTLEETYEVLEAIDNRDWKELTSELGDLLLQVLFYSEMAREDGRFSIDDVLDALSNKLISRHPHVFGDVKAEDAQQVLRNWEAFKAEERRRKTRGQVTHRSGPSAGDRLQEAASGDGRGADVEEATDHRPQATDEEQDGEAYSQRFLDSVSTKMPALLEAHKISSRAAHVGFDWPQMEGLFDKLAEETRELQAHIQHLPPGALKPRNNSRVPEELRERIEDEVGDLFFVLVNIARYLAVDPESALRKTNRKFRRRFGWMEEQLQKQGKQLHESSLDEMEALWQEAKKGSP
jgi:nucleoside triphosphate diphosphatase